VWGLAIPSSSPARTGQGMSRRATKTTDRNRTSQPPFLPECVRQSGQPTARHIDSRLYLTPEQDPFEEKGGDPTPALDRLQVKKKGQAGKPDPWIAWWSERDRTVGLLNAMRSKCLCFLMYLGYWNGRNNERESRLTPGSLFSIRAHAGPLIWLTYQDTLIMF